jgi:hypothetical protein
VARKSWSEKLSSERPRKVKPAPKDFADVMAGQKMLLTTARDVAAYLKTIRKGHEIDVKALRTGLARKYDADIACPVVTGICLRIVAEAVGEQLDAGVSAANVVPVWRAMPAGAPIWSKLENGKGHFHALRKAEKLPV